MESWSRSLVTVVTYLSLVICFVSELLWKYNGRMGDQGSGKERVGPGNVILYKTDEDKDKDKDNLCYYILL